VPLDVFLASTGEDDTWRPYRQAQAALSVGKVDAAREALTAIATDPGREAQQRLFAWHFLRQSGGQPPISAKREVLGVVIEAAMDKGVDLLAAYADRTARYYNYAGPAVIWLRPDSSLDDVIDTVLQAAQTILPNIGPWVGPRRPPPQDDRMRLNILTPFGLHFGEGRFGALEKDGLAGPLVLAATRLMVVLTSLPGPKSKSAPN